MFVVTEWGARKLDCCIAFGELPLAPPRIEATLMHDRASTLRAGLRSFARSAVGARACLA
jgi:hypothetical protein